MADMSIEVRGADEVARSLPRVDTRRLLEAGAAEYKRLWRARFDELDAKGNKKGFPSGHFWIEEGKRKTDVAEIGEAGARVTCDSRAVAMRASGGTVRPRSAKALAIPLTPQAYAAGWPSNSGLPLAFVPIKSAKNPAVRGKLVEARATRISYGRDGGVKKGRGNDKTAGTAHYLLVTKAQIPAMGAAAVMPEEAAAREAVAAKVGEALDRQIERAKK